MKGDARFVFREERHDEHVEHRVAIEQALETLGDARRAGRERVQHVEDGGDFGLEAAGDGRRALRRHGGAGAARIGERRQEERRDGTVAAQVRLPVQTRRPAPAAIGVGPNSDEDKETASLCANEAVSRWHTRASEDAC